MSDVQFSILLIVLSILLIIFLFNIPKRLSEKLDPEIREIVNLRKDLLAYKSRVYDLEEQLKIEREKNLQLNKQIEEMKLSIEKMQVILRAQQEELSIMKTQIDGNQLLTKQKATLLVMGDGEFGETDRNAMRRAGVLFHRLTDGSFLELKEELQRKRHGGKQYKVVHISSHAGRDGIQFSDGTYSGMQISDIMDGVELLFLASCDNVSVADYVHGVVPHVIVVYEQIENEDMQNFVFSFYNELKRNFNIVSSFQHALNENPVVGEYVELL